MNPKEDLPPIHPGEFLKEIIDELGISQAEFARAVGRLAHVISHVIKGQRPVTAEMTPPFLARPSASSPSTGLTCRRPMT